MLRKKSTWAVLTLLAVLALVWWSRRDPIDQLADEPDQLILYSVDGPSWNRNERVLTAEQAKGEVLHGFPVLGKVEVAAPERKREILAELKDAVRNKPSLSFACFIPRHALRLVEGRGVTDVMICFECRNYEMYRKSESRPDVKGNISPSAGPLLDQVLTEAGVTLAPKK